MTVRSTALALFLSVAAGAVGAAQEPGSPAPAAPATINVFLDCSYNCDFDFVRTEVPYVNWVRDRADADVHLLVTVQGTGGGGAEYVLNFIGQRAFAQTTDTLKYVASVNTTSDDRRRGYTQTIKTGLVRYIARTAAADRLRITLAPPAEGPGAAAAASQRDPWKAWVFSLSANGNTDGDANYQSLNGRFNLNANRTTVAFKSSFGGRFSYDQSDTRVDSGNSAGTGDTTYTTIKRNWNASTQQVKSLTEHWSAGFNGSVGSQSYSNQRLFSRANLAVEYNLFPYKESTRRQLRIQYGAGYSYYLYEDTTIYNEIREILPTHYASVSLAARQPWGSAHAELSRNALILLPSFRNTQLYVSADVRIFKGFSVDFGGGYSWVHDQLSLKKEGATEIEVLLRQQQLASAYFYWGYAGLRYTFGSIFNNVVNPRFGGSDF
jgi:hypothetical protein